MEMLSDRNAHAPPALRSHLCQTASLLGSSSIGPSDVPSQSRRALLPLVPPVFFSPFFPQGHSRPPPSPQPGLSPLSALCPFDSRHGPRPPALTTPSSPVPSPFSRFPRFRPFILAPTTCPLHRRQPRLRRPLSFSDQTVLTIGHAGGYCDLLRPVKRRTARKSRCETLWEPIERGFFGNPTTYDEHSSSRLTTVDRTPNPINEDDADTDDAADDTTHQPSHRLTVRSSLAIPNSEGAIDFFTTFIDSFRPPIPAARPREALRCWTPISSQPLLSL